MNRRSAASPKPGNDGPNDDEHDRTAVPARKRTASDSSQTLLVSNPSKWRNMLVRTGSTALLIGLFSGLVFVGHNALVAVVGIVQLLMFNELITLAHKRLKQPSSPESRGGGGGGGEGTTTTTATAIEEEAAFSTRPKGISLMLSWYFLFVCAYYFYGKILRSRIEHVAFIMQYAPFLVDHINFVFFSLYTAGIVMFVFTLEKSWYKFQFKSFAWTHMTIFAVILTSSLAISTLYEGLILFIVSVSLIVINDIMAYVFGFLFGRTPLIKISPKKTWEGFIGALFSTIIFGIALTEILRHSQFMVCPRLNFDLWPSCKPSPIFLLTEYQLPVFVNYVFGISTLQFAPIHFHIFWLSIFASLIAPFGGFFASGLKRTYQVKDFSQMIPGHGGITDRMDCQLLMAVFVYVYYQTFMKVFTDVDGVLARIAKLDVDNQLLVHQKLTEVLSAKGLL